MKKLLIEVLVLLMLVMVTTTMSNALNVINEDIKILASDAAAGDVFGFSVAIDGDTAIVGACYDDDAGPDAGSAYILARDEDIWTEQIKLMASDGKEGDTFGWSVAISGDYAVVGTAIGRIGPAGAGSAYIFYRNQGGPGNWGQQAKLMASDSMVGDAFGGRVAIDGDTVVVGAFQPFLGPGAAYVFKRSGTTWTEQAKLAAIDGEFNDAFGWSVAISEDTVIIGAPTGLPLCWGFTGPGSAYIFQRNQGGPDNWGQQAKLIPGDGELGDQFGFSLSISEDTVLVGAVFDDVGDLAYAGSAYVFVRDDDEDDEAVWRKEAKLTASDASVNTYFGTMVSLSEDTAVVSAMSHDWTGSGYIFDRAGRSGNWRQQSKLLASDGQAVDEFGVGLAIKGNTIMVGAPYTDDAGQYSGSIYIFSDWRLDDDDEDEDYGDEDDDRAAPTLTSTLTDSELGSNYPNPFNPETWIPYRLGIDAYVVIRISDASGRLVRTLELGHKAAGAYTSLAKAAYWDGRNEAGEQVSSGVYFCTIQAGEFTATKKMVVAK